MAGAADGVRRAADVDDPLLAACSLVGARDRRRRSRRRPSRRTAEVAKRSARRHRARVAHPHRARSCSRATGGERTPARCSRSSSRGRSAPVACSCAAPAASSCTIPLDAHARARHAAASPPSSQPRRTRSTGRSRTRGSTPLDLFRFAVAARGAAICCAPLADRESAAACSGMLPPYFIGLLVDTVIPEAARNQLVQLAVILGVVVDHDRRLRHRPQPQHPPPRNADERGRCSRRCGIGCWRCRCRSSGGSRAGDLAQRVGAIDAMRQCCRARRCQRAHDGMFSVFLFAQLFYYSVQLALLGTTADGARRWPSPCCAGYRKLRVQRERDRRSKARSPALVLQLLTGIAKLRVAGAEGRAFADVGARVRGEEAAVASAPARSRTGSRPSTRVPGVCRSCHLRGVLLGYVRGGPAPPRAVGRRLHRVQRRRSAPSWPQMLGVGDAAMSVLLDRAALRARQADPGGAAGSRRRPRPIPGELSGAHRGRARLSFRYSADGPLDPRRRLAADRGPASSSRSSGRRAPASRRCCGCCSGSRRRKAASIYYDGQDLSQLDVAEAAPAHRRRDAERQDPRRLDPREHRRLRAADARRRLGGGAHGRASTTTSSRCRWACTPCCSRAARRSRAASGSGC